MQETRARVHRFFIESDKKAKHKQHAEDQGQSASCCSKFSWSIEGETWRNSMQQARAISDVA